jgi:translation initiation factor 3 subunit D
MVVPPVSPTSSCSLLWNSKLPLDTITVNENSADPPVDSEKETTNINSATSLALEAMFINTNFAIQVVKDDTHVDFPYPNPFSDDETEQSSLASAGYRYRMFDLSVHEDEDVRLILRTEVDALVPGANAAEGQGLMTIKALNEFDSKAPGAGGAPDWRSKLDGQRGAVVATEMKNNSFKMARWAVQSILAGADVMKLGCVLLPVPPHPHCLTFLLQMGVPRQP